MTARKDRPAAAPDGTSVCRPRVVPGRRPGAPVLTPVRVFLLVSLPALVLNVAGLPRGGSMWRDESVTYQVAHRSVPEIWGMLHHVDAVHGAYYFLMHGIFSVWEGGLWALRLPSALAMSVCSGLVALIGTRMSGTRAGVVGGFAFALVPNVQMYAQEGRSYAVVCAFVALATYLCVAAVDRRSPRVWAGYGVALIVASYLHPFAVLSLLSHGITIAASPLPRQVKRQWAVVAAGVVAATLPPAAAGAGQSDQISWIGMPGGRDWTVIAATTVIGLLGSRLAAPGPRQPFSLSALSLPLLLAPTAALLLASLHDPVYLDRYVLYTNIGLALLAAGGLDGLAGRLSRRGAGRRVPRESTMLWLASALAVTSLLPVTLQMRTPESRKDDVTEIAETVRGISADGDGVLFMPARRREWAMSSPEDYRGLDDLALGESPVKSRTLEGRELGADAIRRRIMATPRIVALMDPEGQPLDRDPEEAVKRETLARFFVECGRSQAKGAQIVLFARPRHCGT